MVPITTRRAAGRGSESLHADLTALTARAASGPRTEEATGRGDAVGEGDAPASRHPAPTRPGAVADQVSRATRRRLVASEPPAWRTRPSETSRARTGVPRGTTRAPAGAPGRRSDFAKRREPADEAAARPRARTAARAPHEAGERCPAQEKAHGHDRARRQADVRRLLPNTGRRALRTAERRVDDGSVTEQKAPAVGGRADPRAEPVHRTAQARRGVRRTFRCRSVGHRRRAARRAVRLPSTRAQDHREERAGSTGPRDRNPLAVDRREGPRPQVRAVRQPRGTRVLDRRSGSRDRRRPSATGREARTRRHVRPRRERGNSRARGGWRSKSTRSSRAEHGDHHPAPWENPHRRPRRPRARIRHREQQRRRQGSANTKMLLPVGGWRFSGVRSRGTRLFQLAPPVPTGTARYCSPPAA